MRNVKIHLSFQNFNIYENKYYNMCQKLFINNNYIIIKEISF